jgi:hypothetical protein
LVPSAQATVTLNPPSYFQLANINRVNVGASISFWKIINNGTWLELDQSYSAKHYTEYFLAITTSSDTLVINSWFPTIDSSNQTKATLTASTDLSFDLYSPNFQSEPIVYGATVTAWSSNTLSINALAGDLITIWAVVDESSFNGSPENVSVEIINMDVGNYVFSETKYYTFSARYWDSDGYDDLASMSIAFYDGVHWVNATYDGSTFTLDSGLDVASGENVVSVGGSSSVVDSKVLQVDFKLRFNRYIMDAYDVDIYVKCVDASGSIDGWELMQANYFNIYNLGGHSTLETYGNAGRIPGGDIFDLYTYTNNSMAKSTIEFNNLQHIKLLPTYRGVVGYYDPGIWVTAGGRWNYSVSYYVHGQWIDGWKLSIHFGIGEGGDFHRYWTLECSWYQQNTLVKYEEIAIFPNWQLVSGSNITTSFWIDFWFNKANSSSVGGARINSYYYPMTNTASPWWTWISGQNWGYDENKTKESMFFTNLLDENGNILHAQEIEMVKFSFSKESGYFIGDPGAITWYSEVAKHDIFDITLGGTPLSGIQTPVFDETKLPAMPQSGFLGSLFSVLSGLWKSLSDIFGPAILGFWTSFVGFLDTIFTWLGWKNGFSQILSTLSSFLGWLSTSISALLVVLEEIFLVIVAGFGTVISYFVQFINTLTSMYGYLVWIWEGALPYWSWVPDVILSLLPFILLLAVFWHIQPLFMRSSLQSGLEGVMARCQLTIGFVIKTVMFLWRIVDFVIDTVYRLVEMVPLAE